VDTDDERDRARRRRDWPIEVRELLDHGSDDLSATTTAEERLAMMWPLAVEAWRVANKAIPEYSREDTPSRIIRGYRRGDSRADS
jgi:hypothetical protein